MNQILITSDMIARFNDLNKQKKEIDAEMDKLKEIFHHYFDNQIGENLKGELIDRGIKIQRQIRKYEKYKPEPTVHKLEEMNMKELIKTVQMPDEEKIQAAIHLGLITSRDLEDCKQITYSKAISVRQI